MFIGTGLPFLVFLKSDTYSSYLIYVPLISLDSVSSFLASSPFHYALILLFSSANFLFY